MIPQHLLTADAIERMIPLKNSEIAAELGIAPSTFTNRMHVQGKTRREAIALGKGAPRRPSIKYVSVSGSTFPSRTQLCLHFDISPSIFKRIYAEGIHTVDEAVNLTRERMVQTQYRNKIRKCKNLGDWGDVQNAKMPERTFPNKAPVSSVVSLDGDGPASCNAPRTESIRKSTVMADRIWAYKEPCYRLGWYKDWGRCAMCPECGREKGKCAGLLDHVVYQ